MLQLYYYCSISTNILSQIYYCIFKLYLKQHVLQLNLLKPTYLLVIFIVCRPTLYIFLQGVIQGKDAYYALHCPSVTPVKILQRWDRTMTRAVDVDVSWYILVYQSYLFKKCYIRFVKIIKITIKVTLSKSTKIAQ